MQSKPCWPEKIPAAAWIFLHLVALEFVSELFVLQPTLACRFARRFIGKAEDAQVEYTAHNKGEFKGTKAFKPWQMEWCSDQLSRNDALRLEEELRHHKTNTPMLESITHKHEMGM